MASKLMLQIAKGLQAIPIIGGFIPDYKSDMITTNQIRDMVNKAYQNLDNLTQKEKQKLYALTDQIEELGRMEGSPALISFAQTRANEIKKQAEGVEKKIQAYDTKRQIVENRANDLLSAEGTEDRFNNSKMVKSFEKSVTETDQQ